MNRRPLSNRQRQVLDELIRFTADYGYQPSYKELAERVGVSDVEKHISIIEAKGWIRRTGKPRAITILPLENLTSEQMAPTNDEE